MTPDKVEAALGVLRELISRFDATIPTPMNHRGESTMRIEHFVDLSHEAKQALSVLTEALAERGWRPIESAPRDGSCVLLADADCVTPGFYHDGSECYGHRGGAGFFDESDRGSLLTASNFHATHWQPLPEPPHDR